jgi:hypothetical protein
MYRKRAPTRQREDSQAAKFPTSKQAKRTHTLETIQLCAAQMEVREMRLSCRGGREKKRPRLSLESLQGGHCAQQISQGRAAGIGDARVAEQADGG